MKFTIKKLPEICEIKTGKRDANHATQNGKYRFYTCANQYSFCDTFSFSGKSVIVPGNGDIGLVFYYDGEFEAYQRTYVLQNISIDAKYLYYHLLYKWRHINSGKQYGSTVRYVRMSNFTSYTIPVPSIDEQKRIVAKIEELFSELDNGVETLKKTKQQLAVYRQAVLKEAFEGTYPKVQLKNISKALSGYAFKSKRYTDNGSHIVVKIGNVKQFNFDFSRDLTKTDEIDGDILDKYLLKHGDLLITLTGTRGRRDYGYVTMITTQTNFLLNQRVAALRFDTQKALPEFYQYYLQYI